MATVYEKDGEYRVATRVRDEVQLEWDGWKRSEKAADEVDAPNGPYKSRTPSSPEAATYQAREDVGAAKAEDAKAQKEADADADQKVADAQAELDKAEAAKQEGVDSPQTAKPKAPKA